VIPILPNSTEYGRSRPLLTSGSSGGGSGGGTPTDISTGIDASLDVNSLVSNTGNTSTTLTAINTSVVGLNSPITNGTFVASTYFTVGGNYDVAAGNTGSPLILDADNCLKVVNKFDTEFTDPNLVIEYVLNNNTSSTSSIATGTSGITALVLQTLYFETLTNNTTWLQFFIRTTPPIVGTVPIFSFKCLGNSTAAYAERELSRKGFSLGNLGVGTTLYWGTSSAAGVFTPAGLAKSMIINIGRR
jgi:hypothetical protein